jgi:pyrroline-5-carboxylate reductase
MKMGDHHIGFVGFGHLAQTIFTALERAKIVPRSQVLFLRRDPAKMKANEQTFKITATSLENLVDKSDLIFLCMRPEQAELALGQLKAAGSLQGKGVIALLAGKKISFYRQSLGDDFSIVRAMPNIASSVLEGMTILSYGPGSSVEFRSTVQFLFSSLGEVAELNEDLMDVATAMAGSGPGFVFRLIESMARAGEKAGISYAQALKISAQTFAGASRLISRGELPGDLIAKIATPNGVTQAGFDVMSSTAIEQHFHSVIEAAAKRSRELSVSVSELTH